MLYGAYCRVSSEEQAKNETIDAQIDNLNAYFKTNNITVPEERWYLDDGVSGELILRDRPAGAKLLLDALEGKITHLVIVRVNRIARDDYAAQEAFHTLKNMGVSLISLSEPFNYFEPSGQMMATVFSSFAAYDRATIKKNLADGKASKARKGKLPQGTIVYGYKINEDMMVEINPEQAEIVKLIYKLYIEDRMSYRVITDYLTSMGVPAPADYKKGKKNKRWYTSHKGGWCEYSVNKILKSDVYTGIYPYKPPGQNPIDVPIPEIISSETYFTARKIAREKRDYYAPNIRYKTYLLRGLVKCAVCDSFYVGTSSNKGKNFYYRCTRKKSETCNNKNINALLLESLVWEDLCETFRNPKKLIEEVSRKIEAKSVHLNKYADEIKEIDKRISDIALERKKLIDLYAKGTLAEAELNEAIAEREEALKTLKERKEYINQQLVLQQNQEKVIDEIIDIADSINLVLDTADNDTKRFLFRKLIDTVEIHPGEKPKIRVSYKFGLGLFSECYLVR